MLALGPIPRGTEGQEPSWDGWAHVNEAQKHQPGGAEGTQPRELSLFYKN